METTPDGKSCFASNTVDRHAHKCRIHKTLAGIINPPDVTWHGVERRSIRRLPYPKLITLQPVDENLSMTGNAIVVVGRNLSISGLDFFHNDPWPEKWHFATLDVGPDRIITLLLNVTWCRFIKAGWYDGGGQFIQIVEDDRPSVPTSRIK